MTPSKHFATPPNNPTIQIKPYTPHIPQPLLDDLQKRLHNSADILTTFENSYSPEDADLGIKKDWLEESLGVWKSDYDW
jgi:microsomal epoxide hydrolase